MSSSDLTRAGTAPVVRASDGALYVLPLLLAAYRAGTLRPDSPEEQLARAHWAMRPAGEPGQQRAN